MNDAFLQENVPYIVRRGEEFYFCFAELDRHAEPVALHIDTQNKILDIEDFDESYNPEDQSIRYYRDIYVYDVYPLTVENYEDCFPEQIRTFEDDHELRDFITRQMKGIFMSNDADYVYAVTVDDGDKGSRDVLELVRINEVGDMQYRQSQDWVTMEGDEEFPTIYDKDMIFIASENETDAVALWDSKEDSDETINESEISKYAALI